MTGATTSSLIAGGVLLMLWLGVRLWRYRRARVGRENTRSGEDSALLLPDTSSTATQSCPPAERAPPDRTAGRSTAATKTRTAPADEPGKAAHARAASSIRIQTEPSTDNPSGAEHPDSATAAFDWDEADLAFIEASAAAQHDLRAGVAPLAPLGEAPFDDDDEPHDAFRSIADAPPSSTVGADLEPSHSDNEEQYLDDRVPSETTSGDRAYPDSSSDEPAKDDSRNRPPDRRTPSDVPAAATAALDAGIQGEPMLEWPSAMAEQDIIEPPDDALDTDLFEPDPDAAASTTFEDAETAFEDDLDLLSVLPDAWAVDPADDEEEAPLYEVDVGGDRLGEYDKAKRLAGDTARRFGDQADELWPVLLDIFQESPWPITQRSVERLLTAGVSCQALALATEIRRIWRDHPEFSQTLPSAHARGERWMSSSEAMSQLSWPRAARLADCWPAYPDAAEIECFLEDLFDHWHTSDTNRRSFPSFQLYLGYATGYLDGTLQSWPELCFEPDDALEDPFDALESPASRHTVLDTLQNFGINRPMAWRPVRIHPGLRYDGKPKNYDKDRDKA